VKQYDLMVLVARVGAQQVEVTIEFPKPISEGDFPTVEFSGADYTAWSLHSIDAIKSAISPESEETQQHE
jgi:hypothetical protein